MDSRQTLSDVQTFGDILIIAIDYDNCFRNQNLDIPQEIEDYYVANQDHHREVADKLAPAMIEANRPVLDTTKEHIGNYEKAYVFIFSNRQSKADDIANGDPSCFFIMPHIVAYLNEGNHKKTEFIPLLLSDIYNKLPLGTAYAHAVEDPYNKRPHEHPRWRFDKTKATLLFAITQEVTNRHPDKKIDTHVFDDRHDIHEAIAAFSKEYPALTPPPKVRTRLFEYAGKEATWLAEIPGKGVCFSNYKAMIRKMGILAATPEADGYRAAFKVGDQLSPQILASKYPLDLLSLLDLEFETEDELNSKLKNIKLIDDYMEYMKNTYKVTPGKASWHEFPSYFINREHRFGMGFYLKPEGNVLFLRDKYLSKIQGSTFARKQGDSWITISYDDAIKHQNDLFRKIIESAPAVLAKQNPTVSNNPATLFNNQQQDQSQQQRPLQPSPNQEPNFWDKIKSTFSW